MTIFLERKRYVLNHPSAKAISIIKGEHTYSSEGSSEIAFLDAEGEFVHFPIEPFALYWEHDVYGYVPDGILNLFINQYAVKEVK